MTPWRPRKRSRENDAHRSAAAGGEVEPVDAEFGNANARGGAEGLVAPFTKSFTVTEHAPDRTSVLRLADRYEHPPAVHDAFLATVSGCTFNHGLYRFHDAESSNLILPLLGQAYPTFSENRRIPFAYDWLGRQFTLDPCRPDPVSGEPLVLLFETAAGQAFEIPHTFERFHQELATTPREGTLAADFFEQWRAESGTPDLGRSQCAGYRIPLFLGGRDDTSNLEVTRHGPEGTSITDIKGA